MIEDTIDEVRNDENEEDIYKDIGDFHFDKELTKLEESNKAYLEDIARLSEKLKQLSERNVELQNVNDILVNNISILLKTAKAEIERKQMVIDECRKKVESRNKRNWFDKADKAQSSEICKICARNIESTASRNLSDIEDGEIICENEEGKNSNSETGRREHYNPRVSPSEDKSVDHTRRRNRRSRGRSCEKYSSTHNLRNPKRSDEHLSRRSASSRSRHRYDSPEKRHYDRRKRSRERRLSSSRSDYSGKSSAPKVSERRKEERWKSQERYGHRSRSSSSRRKENSMENESGSKIRGERKTLETTRRTARECKTKDLKPDREVVKKITLDKEKDKRENQNKEKCDIVKKLSIDEYHQRRSNSSNVRKEGDSNLFARQSVLEDLYEEPVTSRRFPETPKKSLGKNMEEAAVSDSEPAEYHDWSSDESWSVVFGKKTEPTKKPQTLYSRRMEAKLQQQLKEEALALQNLGDNALKTDIQDGEKFGTENRNQKGSLDRKLENSQNAIGMNEQINVETAENDLREEGEEKEKELKFEKSEQSVEVKGMNEREGNEMIVEEGEIVNPSAGVEDGEKDVQMVEGKEKVPEVDDVSNTQSTQSVENSVNSQELTEKVVEEHSEPTQVSAVNPVPEQFGENLVKKLLQLQKCQDPTGFKEFSPLKNNYKLSKISPFKSVPRQHILEYYNLKPSTQTLNNIEPEILDFSFSLPETPGKNFSHPFSVLTFSQEATGEEIVKDIDPSKALDKDKPRSEDNETEENILDAIDVPTEEEDVIEGRKSNDDDIKRTCSSNEKESRAESNTPNTKNESESQGTLEPKIVTEQLDTECVAADNSATERKVSGKTKKGKELKSKSAKGNETREGLEKPYQIRTRSRNKNCNAADRKSNTRYSSKKRTSSGSLGKSKSEETSVAKRKRKLTTSDEEEGADVVSKRKKAFTKNEPESGEITESVSREVEDSKSDESKTEEKETEKAVPDDITSFEVFKTASEETVANRDVSDGAGDIESRIEQKTSLDDLSLSSFQVTALSSTMNITGHVLCLETPNKCSGKFKNLTINEETVMQLEEDKSKASLVSVGNSGDSSTFKILRSYLMLSANDDSEMEVFTENSSCSSGDYSDSGASAFVDLL